MSELASILIRERYISLSNRGAELDIGEHLETLMLLSSNVSSVLELGVRGAVSTAAFAEGLKRYRLNNLDKPKPVLVSVDLKKDEIFNVLEKVYSEFINFSFFEGDCLKYPISQSFDVVFFDTFHVEQQNTKELAIFAPYAKKYLVWHDTTGDWENGETLREPWAWNIDRLVEQGWSREGVTRGLKYAIEPFLEKNKEWKVKARYENNNGLLITEKESQ